MKTVTIQCPDQLDEQLRKLVAAGWFKSPEDAALEDLVEQRINELNRKYGPSFFLFHRPRRWNPEERVWMGYERKRGKLADLNALLRGRTGCGPGERFSLIVGDTSPLRGAS